MKTYQEHKNDIAQAIVNGIVERFGLNGTFKPVEPTPPQPAESTKPSGYDEWVARLQQELNYQFKRGLTVDGLKGPKTLNACPTVKKVCKRKRYTLNSRTIK